MTSKPKTTKPPQHQDHQPGSEEAMIPQPIAEDDNYIGSGKLKDKVAIISGGDSGIGRAISIIFAKEGADVAILYKDENEDARATQDRVQSFGRRCVTIAGDIGSDEFCQKAILQTVQTLGELDIVVNNAAVQFPQEALDDITSQQLEQTFRTNIFSYFFLTQAALPYLRDGSAIINTTSVTAYKGSPHLIDYSSTKGAIVAFTRSLALNLAEKGIRVNGVAPGPIWTPLIPSSFDAEKVTEFGSKEPLGRPGEPFEVAPAYVYLASNDSSYMTGQILHPNGGEIVNG